MSRWGFVAALVLAGVVLATWPAVAPVAGQGAAPGSHGQSLPEVIEAIEKARVTTRILYVTAHPDDEPGGVLAYLARGLHADVALLSLTRGEGGQNAIGPEQAPQLGIIRTEELMKATRVYGTRLFFTRAPDFGYSKTPEETMKIWGDEVLDDMVRVIRTFRPHVIVNSWGGVKTGHGQHQATGLLTPRAYAMAGDEKAFPEQMKEGLRAWKAEALLQVARGDAGQGFSIPVNEISALWGKSWAEIGVEGLLNQRSQGVGFARNSTFFRRAIALVPVDGAKPDAALLATSLSEMARRFPNPDDSGYFAVMKKVDEQLGRAEASARELDWKTSAGEIAGAAHDLESTPFNAGPQNGEAGEIASREMQETMARIDRALSLATALQIDAQAERSEVVAGESFTVTVNWRKRSDAPMEIEEARLALPAGWSVTKEEKLPTGGVKFTVAIPLTNADEHRLTESKEDAETQRTQRSAEKESEIRNLKFESKGQEEKRNRGKEEGINAEREKARTSAEKAAWIYPRPAALVKARLKAKIGGHEFETETEVTATRVTSVSAETRPLMLVPAVTLSVEPKQMVVLHGGKGKTSGGVLPYAPTEKAANDAVRQTGRMPYAPTKEREIVVRVRHYATSAEKITVGIEAPEGWEIRGNGEETGLKDEKPKSENRKAKTGEGAQPIVPQQRDQGRQAAPLQSGVQPPHSKAVEFAGAGDQLVRFAVRPAAKIAPGKSELKAWARRADREEFRTSLEPLVTLPARLWEEPAVAKVQVMDVSVPTDLRVGYVAAENDPIPEALREIGMRVELLDEAALAFGDLSKYDTIAIGIRAYELRSDLARANGRLLEYAAAGGTLVVQYQREGVWNALKPAPYPATASGQRTTDENSPVRMMDPKHPVLNFPNAIGPGDFEGWVQERGLYYWDKFDAKYTPILALRDPGEEEAPGALVYTRTGKGVYIYTGLSFFRQLPEGVAGAYRLFVNLLSQGKAKR